MNMSLRRTTLAFIAVATLALPGTASADGEVLAKGAFQGQSGHATSGGVRVIESATGTQVVLDPDFKFDGAPDPKLGFGKNGYVKSTQFSPLKSNSGQQTYDLPPSLAAGDYTEVWVWCQKYNVPLGVAKLK